MFFKILHGNKNSQMKSHEGIKELHLNATMKDLTNSKCPFPQQTEDNKKGRLISHSSTTMKHTKKQWIELKGKNAHFAIWMKTRSCSPRSQLAVT